LGRAGPGACVGEDAVFALVMGGRRGHAAVWSEGGGRGRQRSREAGASDRRWQGEWGTSGCEWGRLGGRRVG
jgi:hypothetical protein